MKKWIIFLAAAVVTATAGIIGWQRKEEPQVNTEQETETITLKWIIYGERYKESDVVFAEFNDQLQDFMPGVTVEIELVEKDEYREKWDMKMATGEQVDLAWVGTDEMNYTEEVRKGSFMVLDYLLKTHGSTLSESLPEYMWEMEKIDGNIYGIPVSGPLYRSNYVMVFNEMLMNRFGDLEEMIAVNQANQYTTRECFEVFEEFLENAKDHNAIGTGVSYQSVSKLADKGYEGIYGVDSPFVIRIFDEELKVYNKYELESYQACFETMAEWYQKGYIKEDTKNLLDPSSEEGKSKGSIMFMEEYGEKGTVPHMTETEYDAVYAEMDGYRYIGYDGCRNSIVIPKSAHYPQQAMELVALLYSEEGRDLYRLLANGIEKHHYIVVKDNVIARMSDNGNGYLYQISQNTIGNVWQNYETVEGEFQQIQDYNEEAVMSPLMGFSLDTRMIALEMEKINLIVNQYLEELCQGSDNDWESLYQEFINEMKEAGSDKIIEEIQKQIDEFCVGQEKIQKAK